MSFKKTFNSMIFSLRKSSPTIMTISGVATMILGTIFACKETTKLDTVMDDHKQRIEKARTEKNKGREITKNYVKTGFKVVKLYLPAITAEVVGTASVLGGHHILNKRYISVAAAYTTIDQSFRRYRKKVIDIFGEDIDKKLEDNETEIVEEVTEINNEGDITTIEEKVSIADDIPSGYARYFRVGDALAAEPNKDYNLTFLECQKNVANRLLKGQGYLFLNDVYDMLGIKKSVAGQAVGWIYEKNNDIGDNHIDFGIRFVNLKKPDGTIDRNVILLDFNVDGNILERACNNGGIEQ